MGLRFHLTLAAKKFVAYQQYACGAYWYTGMVVTQDDFEGWHIVVTGVKFGVEESTRHISPPPPPFVDVGP